MLSKVRDVACAVPGVIDVEKCRVRASGLVYFIDLHVIVDGALTVSQGHEISHRVKDVLVGGAMGIQDVTIHIEPGRALAPNSRDSASSSAMASEVDVPTTEVKCMWGNRMPPMLSLSADQRSTGVDRTSGLAAPSRSLFD
ncbi:MAG: cation transporter dimerization domain-containing protein [Verrucomicrobiales bacterium]